MEPAKRSTLARSTRRKEGRSAPSHMTIPRKDARSDRIRTTTRPKDARSGLTPTTIPPKDAKSGLTPTTIPPRVKRSGLIPTTTRPEAGSTGRRHLEAVSLIDIAYPGGNRHAAAIGSILSPVSHFHARRPIDALTTRPDFNGTPDLPTRRTPTRFEVIVTGRPYGTTGPRSGPRSIPTSNRSRSLSVPMVRWPSEPSRWCARPTGNSSARREVVHVYRIRDGLIDRMDVEGPEQ